MTEDCAPLVKKVRDAIGNTQLMVPGDLRSLLCASAYANDHVVALLLRDAAQMAINAILDAIAEPSEAVQLAGHNMRSDPVTGLSTSCGVDEIYRAMIAALRKEIEG